MTVLTLKNLYHKLGACPVASNWAEGKTIEEAWAECEVGSWMLCALAYIGLNQKQLVKLCCDIADLAKTQQDPEARRILKGIRKGKKIEKTSHNVVVHAAYCVAGYTAVKSNFAAAMYAACLVDETAHATSTWEKTLCQAADIIRNSVTAAEVERLYKKLAS